MPGGAEIVVLSLGGTIAMTPERPGEGAVPTLDAADLVAGVPALADAAQLRARSFRRVPGAHLTLSDVVALAAEIDAELAGGADGVVVTQGTDTLEEVAFGLDLLVRSDKPVVVTGAMRAPHLAGADGPANLLAAVQAAASPRLRDVGTVVVLNGEIHAARLALKRHTQSPDAFASPLAGRLGWVAEGTARLALRPAARPGLGLPAELEPGRVALLTASLGDDGGLLAAAAAGGFDGIVIEALGGGHLPAAMLEALDAALAAMPVVLASRAQAGEVLRTTYGFDGSERDLHARGVIGAGWLNGRKARVLLALLLGARDGAGAAAERFTAYLDAAAPV
jgi:L-asparaginase